MSLPHLRVYPNPWAVFDHEGIPCGTVPFDPVHGAGSRRWVGARMASSDLTNKPREMMRARRRDGTAQALMSEEPVYRFLWAFDLDEPSIVTDVPHYVNAIKAGELIAADEATATRCGVPFVPRDAALLAAMAAGCAAHQNAHGTPPDAARWPANLRLDALRPATPAEPAAPAKNALRSLAPKADAQPS